MKMLDNQLLLTVDLPHENPCSAALFAVAAFPTASYKQPQLHTLLSSGSTRMSSTLILRSQTSTLRQVLPDPLSHRYCGYKLSWWCSAKSSLLQAIQQIFCPPLSPNGHSASALASLKPSSWSVLHASARVALARKTYKAYRGGSHPGLVHSTSDQYDSLYPHGSSCFFIRSSPL